MKHFLVLCVSILALVGCNRAVSNVQTLISDDCGVNWKFIPPGNSIPSRMGVCALRVSLPNSPMTGDARFRTSFANKVLANVSIGYEYTIDDARAFIMEAKYLGRQNVEGDDVVNDANKYESAENTIIDRRLRELTSASLLAEDIVDFDQGKFEDKLLDQANEMLKARGVKLASLQFVMTPDEQTRQAMDAASARRVYASIGIAELGERLMIAKAGAPKITMNTKADND